MVVSMNERSWRNKIIVAMTLLEIERRKSWVVSECLKLKFGVWALLDNDESNYMPMQWVADVRTRNGDVRMLN